jgi:PhzF family phenazine biosynthesis protein
VIKLDLYQVDSFTSDLFKGNPAGVIFSSELSDDLMQKIALENNLSETAFISKEENAYSIRWFSPLMEIDLCGHATLAAAHIYFTEIDINSNHISFNSKSGILNVSKDDNFINLDFPSDNFKTINLTEDLEKVLNVKPEEIYQGRDDVMCIFNNELTIQNLKPDMEELKKIPIRGLITSAPGSDVDFVSRCFFPITGVDEDPVTGSAHTTLTPYWSNRLNKKNLTAKQISSRGGFLKCKLLEDRVVISGEAVTYMKASILI